MVSKSLSALFGDVEEVEADEVEEAPEGTTSESSVGLNWSPPVEEDDEEEAAPAPPPAKKAKAKKVSENRKRGLESDHWHGDPASRHQTMKIWKITRCDVRPLKLTKKEASVLIDKGISDAATLRADLLTVDGVIDRADGKEAPPPKAKAKVKAAPAEAAPAPAKASKAKAPKAAKAKTTKTSKEDAEEIARLRKQIAGYKAAATRRKNAEAA